MIQPLTERELFIYQLVTKRDMSYRDIADILEISQTGVMKAYQRACKKLESIPKKVVDKTPKKH